jgi:hypothetical protein
MPKKNKVPKKLAGVKIPKMLRNSTLIRSLFGTVLGRQILADALVAGAGAAAAALIATRSDAVAETGEAVASVGKKSGKVVKDAVRGAADAMSDVIGNAAKAVLAETEKAGAKVGAKYQDRVKH